MMNCELKQFHHYGETTYHITHDGRVLSYNGRGAPHELAQYNGKGYRRVRLRGKTFKATAQPFTRGFYGFLLNNKSDKSGNHCE